MHIGIWDKKGKDTKEALRIADDLLIALMKGNNLDINSIFEKYGSIKDVMEKKQFIESILQRYKKISYPKVDKEVTKRSWIRWWKNWKFSKHFL